VEGAGGEIRRRWETVGRLTGQGKPKVAHGHGRLKAEGSASAECHGLAVLPQYREAESTGYFAPQIPSLVGSSSGQDRIRVVATRRKTRTGSDHAAAFVGNHRSRARDQETERSRRSPTDRPERAWGSTSHREAGPQSSAFPVFTHPIRCFLIATSRRLIC